MRISRQRGRAVVLAAVGAAAAAIGLLTWGAGTLDRLERVALDQRFQVRGDRSPPTDVVVVGVDENTQKDRALGRWPVPRAEQARVIDHLAAAGAKVIAYDLELSTPTTGAEDQAIYAAMDAAHRVVLATSDFSPSQGPNVIFRDEDLAAAGVVVGHVAFPDTPDNVFRRVPLGVDGLASFAAAAAGRFTGRPVPGAGGTGSALIDYAGGPGTVSEIPYESVFHGRFDASAVKGRVVVVGLTGQTLGDTHPTPYGGRPMSGPEINANAIATFIAGEPLGEAPGWLDALVIVVMAAAGAAVALRGPAWVTAIGAVLAAAVFLVAAQLAFDGGTVIRVPDPLLALALAAVGGIAVNYAVVDRQRRRLRTEFARFVPEGVVEEVMASADDAGRLGGRRLYCTVMFADLRGFTSVAERVPPETVIEALNRWLGEMSEAILDEGGTVVSYMGDGILALFGAPLERPDHADRAVAAARRMRDERLPAVNAWCAGRVPGDGFAMGVGIATGFVMSGNVGSERRMEYTAVGDTVNVAARLEALTRETGAGVLISDATRAALTAPAPDLEAVGALDVKGRQVPTAVWTLAAPAAGAPAPVSPG